MAALRAVCRPHLVSSFISCSRRTPFNYGRPPNCRSNYVFPRGYLNSTGIELGLRSNGRRMFTRASARKSERTPYESLELDRDISEEEIKSAYRRLAKRYHPDVYDGSGNLEEGETAEARFIEIQAAYELLMDKEQRKQYDKDNRVNPMKASKAWMDWLMKKRKAFEQRGDVAVTTWAEQQQRELNLKVRQLSRSKNDPEEERRILAREKKASMENFSITMKRHTLILKKRDLMRKKAEADKKIILRQLLASEGLELDSDDEKKD